jgi:hypothetical protein
MPKSTGDRYVVMIGRSKKGIADLRKEENV